MSRFLVDMIFIVAVAVCAFFMAEAPQEIKAPAPPPAPKSSVVKISPVKPKEDGQKNAEAAIAGRNIFASSGSYKDKDIDRIPIPDNPYILLGVVGQGPGMKALFREYTGNVTKVVAGQRMIDGFVVAAVNNLQVTLKKEKKRKVFNVYDSSISSSSSLSKKHDLNNSSGRKYSLVGILQGAHKKAVFKDQTGNPVILKASQSFPDGSVLVRIDSGSVILKKGKDEEELTLYKKMTQQTPVQTVPALLPDKKSPSSPPERQRRRYPPNRRAGEAGREGAM